jgi:hypothetical protein
LLDVLQKNAVYECRHASGKDHKNLWYQAFYDFYTGPGRDYEIPKGPDAVRNFKKKVVSEIWPMYNTVVKEATNRLVGEGMVEGDGYDELPLDPYDKKAIEQYATWKALIESHDEAVRNSKLKQEKLQKKMAFAEQKYGAIPRGADGQVPTELTFYIQSEEDEDEDEEATKDADPSTFESSYSTPTMDPSPAAGGPPPPRKRMKATPPPPNLMKSPFAGVEEAGMQVMQEMKKIQEAFFNEGQGGNDKKSQLNEFYKAEKHHRDVGNNERADQFKKRIEALEKELYGF